MSAEIQCLNFYLCVNFRFDVIISGNSMREGGLAPDDQLVPATTIRRRVAVEKVVGWGRGVSVIVPWLWGRGRLLQGQGQLLEGQLRNSWALELSRLVGHKGPLQAVVEGGVGDTSLVGSDIRVDPLVHGVVEVGDVEVNGGLEVVVVISVSLCCWVCDRRGPFLLYRIVC